MKAPLLSALLTVIANAALTHAFYGPSDNVLELTPQNFGPAILDTNQLIAVEFYAPWCGHCQRLAPEWKKAAANLKGLVSVGAVNCDEEANKGLCAMYEIQGFPTIKVFTPELKKHKRTGQLTKVPTDYQGPRDAKSIVDYLLSYQPSNVLFVKWNEKDVKSKKSITLDNFLDTQNETLPKALLFTNKPTTTPLYKALSVDFKDRMLVGEVKHSEKNIVAEFGIQSFPTLIVISPEDGPVKFEGKLNQENLKKFLNTYALPETKKKSEKPSSPKAEPKKKEITVVEDNDTFSKKCLDVSPNTICVVALTEDEDKQDTFVTLNSIKDKVKYADNLNIEYVWVHADQSKNIISQLQIPEDYPSLFFVHPSKHLYRNYVGSWNEGNLQKWLDQVSSGRVQAWPYTGTLSLNDKPEPIMEEEVVVADDIAHDEL